MIPESDVGGTTARTHHRNHQPESETVETEVESSPVCPECGSDVFRKGAVWFELVCGGCGLIVEEHAIDHGPEWRAYNAEEYRE